MFFHSAGACSHSGATYTMTSGTGTCTVRATQLGNANYSAATPVSESVTATPAAATIDVTNVNPAAEDFAADAPVTITAVLAWTGTGAAPTGAVTIAGTGNGTYGATSCGSASGNQITCTAIYTPTNADLPGSYTETAAFAGDNNYSASSSPETNNFAINSATSSTTVTSSANPSSFGQSVTFTATITPENGDVKGHNKNRVKSHDVTGTVSWSANTGCSASTVSGYPGVATCTTSSLSAGTDTVTATYSGDANHGGSTGSVSQTVNNATATCAFSNLTQTYTGAALSPTVTTVPAGLSYSSTGYPDTNAGSYPVTCTITDPSYTGSASGTFVINKATAMVTFSNLTQTYTGAALSPTVTTVPAGLSYSSTGYPDTAAGSYPVTATITNSNYTGSANGTFVINQANPTVSFTGLPASLPYGTTYTLTATSNAGTTATITSTTPAVCTVSGTTVSIVAISGTCAVTATWAGTSNYNGATKSQAGTAAIGVPVITWATPAAISYGTVLSSTQLDATAIPAGGKFVYTPAAKKILTAGTQTLSVTYTPTKASSKDYGTATGTVQLTVNPATSSTAITSADSITLKKGTATYKAAFTVTSYKPTGAVTVTFTNNTTGATLTCSDSSIPATGKGACSETFTAAGSWTVTAAYAGDANHTGSTSNPIKLTVVQ